MPAKQNFIQAVLFDLDDTLTDWSRQEGDYSAALMRHLDNIIAHLETEGHVVADPQGFKHTVSETLISEWAEAKVSLKAVDFGQVLFYTCQAFNLDTARINIRDMLVAYDNGPVPDVTLYPDTISVLDELSRRGYKLGLITNSMLPMWMRDTELQALDLLDYFEVRLSAGDIGTIKPHPQIYQSALAELNVAPERAVFVGDRPKNDIAGANAAGLISVLLTPPHLDYELNGVTPDHIIQSLSDLLPVMALLEGAAETSDG